MIDPKELVRWFKKHTYVSRWTWQNTGKYNAILTILLAQKKIPDEKGPETPPIGEGSK